MKQLTTIVFATLLLMSCNNSEPKEMEPQNRKEKVIATTLQADLDAKKAKWAAGATDEKKKLYDDGIEAIVKDRIMPNAKNVGDKAPNFSLTNATGDTVQLSDYLKKGKVILTWYRGGWCPYCNLTLRSLQQSLPGFKEKGASLLALTPEVPDKSISTSEKHNLEFEVLSDIGNGVARDYGVVFTLIPELAESYQTGFDLHSYNGDESNELPLAATYIINQKGIIEYAFLHKDYRNRAEPSEILENL
jgi:peroxiredoxin